MRRLSGHPAPVAGLCVGTETQATIATDLDDLDAPVIGAFLDHLEKQRNNGVRTRNARLAAIRSHNACHPPLVSWAEVLGARRVFIGAVEQDSSGYPDCRPAYYQAFNRLIALGTRDGDIEIVTPLIHLKKQEIVLRGVELGAPLHVTWSCYQGQQTACGVCESCVLRLRAFAEAGVKDPLPDAGRPLP